PGDAAARHPDRRRDHHDDGTTGVGDASGTTLFVHQVWTVAKLVLSPPQATKNAFSVGTVHANAGSLGLFPEPVHSHSRIWPCRVGKYLSFQVVVPSAVTWLLPGGGQFDPGVKPVKPHHLLKAAQVF